MFAVHDEVAEVVFHRRVSVHGGMPGPGGPALGGPGPVGRVCSRGACFGGTWSCGEGLLPGGAWSGGSAPRGCLVQGGLLPGDAWSGGVPGQGGAWSQGVPSPGGCLLGGIWYPSMH